MIAGNLKESSARIVSIAMLFTSVGLVLLVFGILWPKLPFLATLVAPDWNDFVHGFVIGVALALEIGGVVMGAAALARKRKEL